MLILRKLRRAGKLAIFLGAGAFIGSCNANKYPAAQFPIRVMCFNIRLNTPADSANAWPHRKDMVASMMRFHRADLTGVQEALKDQMDDLANLLPEFGRMGVGRDDGKEAGEYSAIFYLKERFAVLEQKTFWLSETPEKPGSLGWDAACVRIVTWAKFKDKNTGKIFYHFNTHFDHMGERARQESAKLLLRKAAEVSKSTPMMITGDFNATESSPVYAILTATTTNDRTQDASPLLFDARYISKLPHHGADWTFHGFDTVAHRPRIDYIFVNKRMKVQRHGILTDRWNDRYPSDHLPVLAEIIAE
jgi:endonuclease/exonuclease/phosphatase family metal-dependent hydrolase